MGNNRDLEREILDTISRNIKRWENVSQNLKIYGQSIDIKPTYLSVLYKEKDIISTKMNNGGIVFKNIVNNPTGLYINSMIGDELNGYSSGSYAGQQFPRDPKHIYSNIDDCMDFALKSALSTYLCQIADGILIKNEKEYYRLSKEEVGVHQDSVLTSRKLGKKELDSYSKFSDTLLTNKSVVAVDVFMRNALDRNFFVDSEGRNIFNNNYREVFNVTVTFNHESGSQKFYSESVLNPDYKNIDAILAKIHTNVLNDINEEQLAKFAQSGQYPIIFGPSAAGTLFHEGLGGHLLSGSYICSGESTTFKNKIGEKIMPLDINVIDNPLDKTANGYYLFDDEGIRAKRTVLVENGVLKNYLLDRNSAAHFNTNSNGHARAEWVMGVTKNGTPVSIPPEPRTSNMEIYSSKGVSNTKLEEMMLNYCKKQGLEYGLYISSGAGSVDVTTSMFMIEPDAIWKIYTNGTRERIINAVVVGSPYELLQQIQGIGNEYKITLGTCGSTSGGVPVQESAPAIFLPKVTLTAIEEERHTKRLLEVEK